MELNYSHLQDNWFINCVSEPQSIELQLSYWICFGSSKSYKSTLNKTCTAYNRFDDTAHQSYFEEAAIRFVIKNNQCLIGKRCFWGLGTFSIQSRPTISGFVPLNRQLILYRFLGLLGIHSHQFECLQKAKTDEANRPQLFHWPDEKDDLCFSRQWKFFQHDDFHHNKFNQKYMNIVFILGCFSLQNIS